MSRVSIIISILSFFITLKCYALTSIAVAEDTGFLDNFQPETSNVKKTNPVKVTSIPFIFSPSTLNLNDTKSVFLEKTAKNYNSTNQSNIPISNQQSILPFNSINSSINTTNSTVANFSPQQNNSYLSVGSNSFDNSMSYLSQPAATNIPISTYSSPIAQYSNFSNNSINYLTQPATTNIPQTTNYTNNYLDQTNNVLSPLPDVQNQQNTASSAAIPYISSTSNLTNELPQYNNTTSTYSSNNNTNPQPVQQMSHSANVTNYQPQIIEQPNNTQQLDSSIIQPTISTIDSQNQQILNPLNEFTQQTVEPVQNINNNEQNQQILNPLNEFTQQAVEPVQNINNNEPILTSNKNQIIEANYNNNDNRNNINEATLLPWNTQNNDDENLINDFFKQLNMQTNSFDENQLVYQLTQNSGINQAEYSNLTPESVLEIAVQYMIENNLLNMVELKNYQNSGKCVICHQNRPNIYEIQREGNTVFGICPHCYKTAKLGSNTTSPISNIMSASLSLLKNKLLNKNKDSDNRNNNINNEQLKPLETITENNTNNEVDNIADIMPEQEVTNIDDIISENTNSEDDYYAELDEMAYKDIESIRLIFNNLGEVVLANTLSTTNCRNGFFINTNGQLEPAGSIETSFNSVITELEQDNIILNAYGTPVHRIYFTRSAKFGYIENPRGKGFIPAKKKGESEQAAKIIIEKMTKGIASDTSSIMVLNEQGNLVSLSSLPQGSFGYKRENGKLVPANSLVESLSAVEDEVKAGNLVLDKNGNLISKSSLPVGVFGYIKQPDGTYIAATSEEEAKAAALSSVQESNKAILDTEIQAGNLVLNEKGELVPASSMPDGIGYVKTPDGKYVKATSKEEALSAALSAAATTNLLSKAKDADKQNSSSDSKSSNATQSDNSLKAIEPPKVTPTDNNLKNIDPLNTTQTNTDLQNIDSLNTAQSNIQNSNLTPQENVLADKLKQINNGTLVLGPNGNLVDQNTLTGGIKGYVPDGKGGWIPTYDDSKAKAAATEAATQQFANSLQGKTEPEKKSILNKILTVAGVATGVVSTTLMAALGLKSLISSFKSQNKNYAQTNQYGYNTSNTPMNIVSSNQPIILNQPTDLNRQDLFNTSVKDDKETFDKNLKLIQKLKRTIAEEEERLSKLENDLHAAEDKLNTSTSERARNNAQKRILSIQEEIAQLQFSLQTDQNTLAQYEAEQKQLQNKYSVSA